MKVPPDQAVLIRAKRDGRPLRVLTYGNIRVNPLTETATFLGLDVHTLDQFFRGIDTTLEGTRVPVNIRAEMRISYCHSSLLTLENADRLTRTPRPVLLGEIVTAIYARLRQACIGWPPEELRDNPEVATDWVVWAVRQDLAPTALWLGSLRVREVTDDNGFFESMRLKGLLAARRDALRAAGVDTGPDPPAIRTREDVEAEYLRIVALEKVLKAKREADGETDGERAPRLR